ncbi:MAG: D-glycero-beta-D-manno-heptose 1-phosphate adenylyltransferase [Chitinophagaceae bacterium]
MNNTAFPQSKIYTVRQIGFLRAIWRLQGKKIAFTNGCFDILHIGHIASLSQAAEHADVLIVGINSDNSTKRLKGAGRPINGQDERALMLANLLIVDGVVIFDEDTPLELIKTVQPDVLVKGGDYAIDQIVGAREVQSWGGEVIINDLVPGVSTTGLAHKIQHL